MSRLQGFKAFKDRMTVSFGDSVAGSKLKPSVVCHGENPRAFKHIHKHTLPVCYRSSRS